MEIGHRLAATLATVRGCPPALRGLAEVHAAIGGSRLGSAVQPWVYAFVRACAATAGGR